MEDALQPETVQQTTSNKKLILGLAASLILHLTVAAILIGLPGGSPPPAPSVTYVDLNAPQRPAPMALPPKEAAPVPAPEPPTPATPELRQPVQPREASTEPAAAQPAAQPAQPAKVEEQRSRTIMGLGLTKGYFKSIGEGETLRADIKGYYLDMLQVVNEKWWLDEQIDKRRVEPIVVSITVARNGELVNTVVVRSSGNRRYDKAVLEALAKASPLPPLPASYEGDFFQAPIRLVPPLNLMTW